MGEYVRATVDTAQHTLTLWHQADAEAVWRLIKTRQFRLKETIHAVLPQLRRNNAPLTRPISNKKIDLQGQNLHFPS